MTATNADYGEGHNQPVDEPVVVAKTKEELREEERAKVIANCSHCTSAQVAGYATCRAHRPIDFAAAIWDHAYVLQQGAGHDVEMTTQRNALRTWRPQLVHYHKAGDPCNAECHQVFPNDLPYWGGSNIS